MPYKIRFGNRTLELPKPTSALQLLKFKLPFFSRSVQVEIPADYGRISPYHLAQKVIVKGADNSPYWIGTVTHIDAVGNCVKPVPQVKDQEGNDWVCMGIVRDYSEQLAAALDKLNPIEQWNVMAQNYQIFEEGFDGSILC